MDIPRHHCFVCGYDWPMIVDDPKKCPNCQSKHWRAIDVIGAMSDRVLAEMVEYGQAHNFACFLSPAWNKDNVGDLRDDILTAISDGWEWGGLIRDFLDSE